MATPANAYRTHTNSDGVTLYGPDSCVQLSYYDLYLSVKMYPIKPDNERNERSIYDYSNRINCSVSRDDLLYLAYVIKERLLPATKELKPCFVGIRVSKSNTIFCISNGIAETGKVEPYMAIYKNLDKNFRPSERRIFRFAPKKLITKYNPDASEITVEEDGLSGLGIILNFFTQCSALSGAISHMEKYITRFKTNAQFNIINSIAGKLGIPVHTVNTVDRRGTPDWDGATSGGGESEPEALPEAADFSPESISDLSDLM